MSAGLIRRIRVEGLGGKGLGGGRWMKKGKGRRRKRTIDDRRWTHLDGSWRFPPYLIERIGFLDSFVRHRYVQ